MGRLVDENSRVRYPGMEDLRQGPVSGRSIGEGPHIPVAPAIANAVADATGARVRELPVTSERVYRAIKGL